MHRSGCIVQSERPLLSEQCRQTADWSEICACNARLLDRNLAIGSRQITRRKTLPSGIYTYTLMDVISDTAALFRLLGDPTRLRLLRVVARDRFNVTELTAILGLAQSGVSRHLGMLKDAGLVIEDRDGAYAYYRLAPSLRD